MDPMHRQGAGEARERLAALLQERLRDPATAQMIRRSLDAGVVMDTWLAGQREENFTPEALAVIEEAVGILTAQAYGSVFPNYHLSERYLTVAFHELLSSIAMFQAHREKGTLEVGEGEAAGAVERLRAFVAAEPTGLSVPVGLYWLVTSYENYGALAHYGRMPEEDFRFGTFHRPWIKSTLTEEMNLARLMGHLETRYPCPEGQCVILTPEGRRVLEQIRRLLEDSGELAWRMQQQHLALFNELEDYDELMARIAPTVNPETERFLDFAGLRPGQKVLELGCGTGRMTLNVGLYRRVLPGGRVVATDPSTNMLARAGSKARELGAANVEFLRSPAENLPFSDGAFDATVGMVFLHFTDAPRAVREAVRVTKPGGTVALGVAIRSDAAMMPVLPVWFEPIFALARSRGMAPTGVGNRPGEAAQLLREAGCVAVHTVPVQVPVVAVDPVSFVRWALQGPGFFQEVLEPLPYAERLRLVGELQEAGREICRRATLEERTWLWPGEYVRGSAPGPD
ncbi:MAG: methyltransferase domain-containing protein [Thermaerobacter sp.]|jgi:SAM-dependent methyltransferase|nr:methyltransferase domain-containing protein [Thermaerobacter sp.]